MTREQFENEVWSWEELTGFCNDNDCYDILDVLYSWDTVCEWVDDCLVDWARELSWQDLLARLQEFDSISGGDFYIQDDWGGGFREAGDYDFEDLRHQVFEWAVENGVFDGEGDDADEEECESDGSPEEPEEPEDEDVPEEDVSFGEMFAEGVGCVRAISAAALEQAREEDRTYAEVRNAPLIF